jgi:hypothetical protein
MPREKSKFSNRIIVKNFVRCSARFQSTQADTYPRYRLSQKKDPSAEPETEPGSLHYLPLPDALWFLSHPEVLHAPAQALIPLSTLSNAITQF